MSATAFVLAAGLGTRLRPLTLHRPKPLVPVCGVPMLEYALAGCARQGHAEVVVNAHHLAEQVQRWEGSRRGLSVRVVVEAGLLGTGGGLRNARGLLADRFAVVNADVLCDVDTQELLRRVPDGGMVMALRHHPVEAARYGLVLTDSEGVVVRLSSVASTDPVGEVAPDTHFTGIHALDRSVLDLVPDGEQCIVRTAYRARVPERRVLGVVHHGTWIDVGDPAAYLTANLAVLCTTLPVSLDPLQRAEIARSPRGQVGSPPPGVRLEGSVWIGPGARVERGARLLDTVVGPGAVVEAGADLTRCVVWDGCVGRGTAVDTVFYDGGVLAVTP